MSHDNQAYLSFSLEESIWFQKGQEVEELLSISLEPDITIQENDQYVIIRGSLLLSGEYKKEDNDVMEEDTYLAPSFIQSVEEREDGQCNFTHRFPIDITIPMSRIGSIYDVHVEIDSFDYVIPEPSCLKLTADLSIGGLRAEQNNEAVNGQLETSVEQNEEPLSTTYSRVPIFGDIGTDFSIDDEQTDDVDEEESSSFTVEARKQPSLFEAYHPEKTKIEQFAEEPNDVSNDPLIAQKTTRLHLDETPSEVELAETWRETDDSLEQTSQTKSINVESLEIERNRDEQKELDVSYFPQRKEKNESPSFMESPESPSYLESPDNKLEATVESVDDLDESESSSPKKGKKKPKLKKKKTLTLTEFFARKEEDDRVKMKMCIVQEGETVSYFAEKYGVNEQRILRVNRLDLTNDLYVGQVLYIPIKDEQKH